MLSPIPWLHGCPLSAAAWGNKEIREMTEKIELPPRMLELYRLLRTDRDTPDCGAAREIHRPPRADEDP